MNTDAVTAWIRILRDVTIVSLGAFMCIHETVAPHDQPNLYIIGGGLALLGVPPALRLDDRRKTPERQAGEDA